MDLTSTDSVRLEVDDERQWIEIDNLEFDEDGRLTSYGPVYFCSVLNLPGAADAKCRVQLPQAWRVSDREREFLEDQERVERESRRIDDAYEAKRDREIRDAEA